MESERYAEGKAILDKIRRLMPKHSDLSCPDVSGGASRVEKRASKHKSYRIKSSSKHVTVKQEPLDSGYPSPGGTRHDDGGNLVVKSEPQDDGDDDLEDGEIADSDDEPAFPPVHRQRVAPISVSQCVPSRVTPYFRDICRYFREGHCRSGVHCRFVHSGANGGRLAELCPDYAHSRCHLKLHCDKLHGEWPCLDYHVRKRCDAVHCRFSHQPPDEYTQKIIQKQTIEIPLPKTVFKPVRKVLLPTPPAALPSSPLNNANFTPLPLVQPTRTWLEDPLIPQIMSLPSKNDPIKKPLTIKDINTMIAILATDACPDDYFDSIINEYWPKGKHLTIDYQHDGTSWKSSSRSPEIEVVGSFLNRRTRRAAEHRRSNPYRHPTRESRSLSPPNVSYRPSTSAQPFGLLNANAFSFGAQPPPSSNTTVASSLVVSDFERERLDRLAQQQMIMCNMFTTGSSYKFGSSNGANNSTSWTTSTPMPPAYDPSRPPPPLPINMLVRPACRG